MNWYYVQAGQQRGPVSDADLPKLVASGAIQESTLVWHEGLANWQPYGEVRPPGLPAPPPLGTTGAGLGTAALGAAAPVGDVVCSECHQVFPRDQAIQYGTQWVCVNCKPAFIQRLQEGAQVTSPMAQAYAGFWIRFGAYFIDQLIVGVVNFFFSLLVGVATPTNSPEMALVMQGVMMLVGLTVGLIYETCFLVKYSATPGKMALRLKVVPVEGGPMTWGRAIGRYFAKILSGCPTLFIGFIIAGPDEEKCSLHDRICNTRVIKY